MRSLRNLILLLVTGPDTSVPSVKLVCGGEEDTDAKKRSREIDRRLHLASKELRMEYKLLLLGTGESGKSTVIKQVRLSIGSGLVTLLFIRLKYLCYPPLLLLIEYSPLDYR